MKKKWNQRAHVQILCTFTFEYRVYTLIQKNFNQGKADAYGEKKQCTYGLSDWFEFGHNQSKVKARRSGKKQVYLGLFEPKSVAVLLLAWPIAGLLGCVLYLFLECNRFWPKSGQVYLILAKTLYANSEKESRAMWWKSSTRQNAGLYNLNALRQ